MTMTIECVYRVSLKPVYIQNIIFSLALEEAMQSFNEYKALVMNKSYDYLDQRNSEFDVDFQEFLSLTDTLKEHIGDLIEENFASVWETPQGVKFLTRFEKVRHNCLTV